MNRRTALQLLAAAAVPCFSGAQSTRAKVIVAGGGIAGLCCAYALMKKKFEVVVLEASGRTGGHVLTLHDRLADGLYADAGAEHFYRPGYERLWKYIDEFELPVIAYPRRRNPVRFMRYRLYTEEELSTPAALKEQGYNQREIEYMRKNSVDNLPGLYFDEYVGAFEDEYKPFSAKLNHLDAMTGKAFLLQKGASERAAASLGGTQSALYAVWHAAIRRRRNMAWQQKNLFRVRGGNQRITDAFAVRLGDRVRMGSPVTGIEQTPRGVRIQYMDGGRSMMEEADYFVTAMPLATLRRIPVKPAWPEAKRYVIENMPHDSHCRVIFQSRTRFWETDGVSPNMSLGDPSLGTVWEMAEEVPTRRGILIGTAGITNAEKATAAYRRRYTGKSENIEASMVVDWTMDPWAMTCLPTALPPGELPKYWPQVIQPVGRIHFAGVYADNYPFGLEGAVRSAERSVREIEAA